MPGRTLLAKIWDQHVIARLSEDTDLLHVDRHLLHDLGGSRGLLDLKSRGLKVHNPELTFATPDHAISTARGRAGTSKVGQELLAALRVETAASDIQMFDIDQPGQGIVHVIGPELGLSLPGCLIVCGDSHTCTHGGLGCARVRYRLERAYACAGNAGADPAPAEDHAREVRRKAPARRHSKGYDPRADRAYRGGRRSRLCRRVCRKRHSRHANRRTLDPLQSFDRTR